MATAAIKSTAFTRMLDFFICYDLLLIKISRRKQWPASKFSNFWSKKQRPPLSKGGPGFSSSIRILLFGKRKVLNGPVACNDVNSFNADSVITLFGGKD